MKHNTSLSFFFAVGLLLTALLLPSCRKNKRDGGKGEPEPKPAQYKTIVIVNSETNNTYNQPQFHNITVQNNYIDNSRAEDTRQIINNMQYNTENITINNTRVGMAVDNSITNNYVSQTAVQNIYNDNRRYDGNKYYEINEGDRVEITNVNIGGVVLNGIIAEVNNSYTYSSNTDILISQETYQQIINLINNTQNNDDRNYHQVQCSKCGKYYDESDRHRCGIVKDDHECPKCGAVMERGHKCYPCRKCGEYFVKGTKHICYDKGGGGSNEIPPVNIFTIIGFIVVVLFILWVISWFR